MSSSNFHILRMPLMTIKILVLLLLIKCDLYLKNNENYLWVWLPVPFKAKCVLYLWESSRLTTEVSYFPQKSWSFLNCLLIVFSWAFLGRNMSPKSSVSLRAKRDQTPCAVDVADITPWWLTLHYLPKHWARVYYIPLAVWRLWYSNILHNALGCTWSLSIFM